MFEQSVPGLQLVDESVVSPKRKRANRIQGLMEEQTLVIPALQVVEEPHEKLLRMRDGKWEERGLGDAKLHLHRKTGKACFMMRKESNHYGNYRQFLRAQRP